MEAGCCQEEPFCRDESSCSAEVRSADGERFRGEPLSGNKEHSQDEAHFPSETHSVDEAPRDAVLSYAAQLPREQHCFLICSRGEE